MPLNFGFKLCKYIKFSTLESHVDGNILKSHGFYRLLLNRNVVRFIFIVFEDACSLTGYLKRDMFRLENYHEFSRVFLSSQLHGLEDFERNALEISDIRNQVHHRTFFRE